ncbi:MAG: hypothetical protein P9X26_09225 [Candidatus Stygibacter frigidus]|nr:hypothetical protein [Candidatus Stygibacter frigidus]
MTGAQLGTVNYVSEDMVGLQMGFLNIITGGGQNFQLGMINYNENGFLKIFPFFNFSL